MSVTGKDLATHLRSLADWVENALEAEWKTDSEAEVAHLERTGYLARYPYGTGNVTLKLEARFKWASGLAAAEKQFDEDIEAGRAR